ncbi:hypothetical protein APHAL10511_004068 [Amanita phalloides]|nr:hypothetical protein APHAL10511_004068 [Amanita phalloides]
MGRFSLLTLLALTASTYAAPRSTEHLVKETVTIPRGWVKHSKASPDHVISLRIGLPQPNFPTLERLLYEVSDPDHSRYGQHLSKAEVEKLVAPHSGSVTAVNGWLAAYGLGEPEISRSPAGDWIKIAIPISVAEAMLDTEYHVYQHETDGGYLVRTPSYSLPKHLHEHIDIVQPTTMFGRFKPYMSNAIWLGEGNTVSQYQTVTEAGSVDPSCDNTITIKCLQQIYNATGYTPSAKGNSIGITGYDGQYANLNDLQKFYADQRPDARGSSFKFVSVKGGTNPQNPSQAGIEANLDVQFAFGLSHPIPGTFYSTPGAPPFKPDDITTTDTNEPYTDWLDFVLASHDVPHVVSTSYGDDEQTVPESYARRVCNGFAQLGARGVSVIFASGDFGVGDGNTNPQTQKCFSNDGKHTKKFIPSFPASCPFVTAVGATTGYPEVAVSKFYSGGGFSNYFDQGDYQKAAVKAYLNALPHGLYSGLYNPKGRAYPDVAAQGDNYRVFVAGTPGGIAGTSASAPTFAALVALLNDARFKAGQPQLGFLNPLIYKKKIAAGFNSITVGNNAGCGTDGFKARAGWNPVTGLGTPNFGLLKHLVT